MNSFFNRDNLIKVLVILSIITLPIVLAIVFGKLNLNWPFVQKTPTPTTTTIPGQASKVFLYCPSVSVFCKSGTPIVVGGTTLGFGAKLPANTPVLAAFNGKVSISQTTLNPGPSEQTLQTLQLTDLNTNTNAIYYFVGNTESNIANSKDTIKVGTKLGTITQNITSYNTSLLFQLFVGSPATVPQQALQANSFITPKQ